ncbi:hypothetical protein AVEN_13822-1 [Araneus ventricosus]|uniref:RNase H type-1 domain-containing protein n=1 Tax=Araneus ventricosus TaxID=182803 RepID=A0A4Y2U851_ARAVE|nr:hypothetical protein AVEN_13822-1 [Araneus ventricosus]
MAVLHSHTPHHLVRHIQSLLTHNQNILVRWLKAHVGYRGNEEADTLAKKTFTEGVVVEALKPRCELKKHLQELFFKKMAKSLGYWKLWTFCSLSAQNSSPKISLLDT